MASLLNISCSSLLMKGLPYDSEVKYLESSGTQWIDTGIIPTATTGIRVDVYRINSNDTYMVGLRNTSGDTRWGIGQSSRYYYCYGGYSSTTTTYNTRAILDLNYLNDKYFRVKNYSTLIDDNSISLPTLSFTPSYSIRLFGASGYAASQNYGKWLGRIYSVKISQENNLAMDLIPVRVGQVGYMYDKVSGQLFGNSGTGSFTLGPDVGEEPGDAYVDNSCLALYHFDGTLKNEVSGSYGSGGTSYSSDIAKFGQSRYLNSNGVTGSSVTLNQNSDFTVDCWAYIQYNNTYYNRIWQLHMSDSSFLILAVQVSNASDTTGNVYINIKGTSSTVSSTAKSISLDTWHHFAVVYDGTAHTAKLYIDGILEDTISVTINTGSYTMYIGRMRNDNTRSMKGYIDEFHVSGQKLWNGNFTPPVSEWELNS